MDDRYDDLNIDEQNVPDYIRMIYGNDPARIREYLKEQNREAMERRARFAMEEKARSGMQTGEKLYGENSPGISGAGTGGRASGSADGSRTGGRAASRAPGYPGADGTASLDFDEQDIGAEDEDEYDDDDRPYFEDEEDEEPVKPSRRPVIYGRGSEETDGGAAGTKDGKGKSGAGSKAGKGRAGSRDKKSAANSKGKRIAILVVVGLIAIATALVIGNSIIKNLDFGTYSLGYVTYGEVAGTGEGTAYFARSSDALFSPADGIFISARDEGEHVEAGGTVGYISTEEHKGVVARLDQINATILALSGLGDGTAVSNPELEGLSEELEGLKRQLSDAGTNGRLSEVGDITRRINEIIEKRNEILTGEAEDNDNIMSLKREKQELEAVIREKLVPVNTTKAGVVSYYISDTDNIENEFYEKLSVADLSASVRSASLLDNAGVASKLNEAVVTGDKICRIISNQDYYVILALRNPVEDPGNIITLRSDDLVYQSSGTLQELDFGPDYLIINTMRGLKSSLRTKNVPVSFDINRTTGLCVPMSALTDIDKNHATARLALVKAGYVQFVYVGIVAYDDEKAIISASPFNDSEIVYNGDEPAGETGELVITAGDCYVVEARRVRNGQQIG